MKQQKQARICPHCRKLTDGRSSTCMWCGRPVSGFMVTLAAVFADEQRLLRFLIGLNIGMFVLSLALNSNPLRLSLNPLTALSPDTFSLILLGATGTEPVNNLDYWWALGWWTLVSANYLHGGILHILFNMVALKQIAPVIALEYGSHRFFIIYSLSGAAGFLISYAAGVPLTIGASSSVCGLVGALLYFGWSRGGMYGNQVFKQVVTWIVFLFLIGFVLPAINNWGHFGGILGGVILARLLGYQPAGMRKPLARYLAWTLVFVTLTVLLWAAVCGILVRFEMV